MMNLYSVENIFAVHLSYSVSISCHDDLARIRDLPACGEVNLPQVRPPCELREPSDTRLLLQIDSVGGSSVVCPGI